MAHYSLFLFLFLSFQTLILSVNSQTPTPSCASKLVPCGNAINSTSPPASCCTPLKDAVTNDLACICAIYEDPSLLKDLGITYAEGQNLAKNCGIDSSQFQCKAPAPSGTTTPSPPPPHTGTAGERTVRIGVSGFITFLISWFIWI